MADEKVQQPAEKKPDEKVEQAAMQQVFTKYISDKKILIADEAASARTGLARTLVELGAKTSNIILAGTYAVAEEEMNRTKPHVVLCDYNIGRGIGLNLLQSQRKARPESRDSLFILVTANTSQSAVAQAAEEDVDTFIIKPYTLEVLRRSLLKAAMAKVKPDDYAKKVEEGKVLLNSGKLEESIAIFKEAITLNSKPSLAYFYLGQSDVLKKLLENAEGSYQKGLGFNRIHYKCLVGLFDNMMERKMYSEAYDVVKKIAQYFPANPQRLAQVLRLAIQTKNYDDIESYYQTFTNMDQRSEEIIRYVCASLVVCGKYYLAKNFNNRGLALFQKAAATGTGRPRILREIIMALIAFQLIKEAADYLKKFPAEVREQADFLVCDYVLFDQTGQTSQMVERGRQLIQKGIHDVIIYYILIRRSIEGGLADAAEDLCQEGRKRWPELGAMMSQDVIKTTTKQAPVPVLFANGGGSSAAAPAPATPAPAPAATK